MKVFLKIRENHIGKKEYEKYHQEILQYNLDSIRKISFIGMLGGIVLTILSLPPIHFLHLLQGYLGIAVIFTAIYMMSKTMLVYRREFILPMYYTLLVVSLFLAIIMGTFWGRDTNATTFIMLLFVIPMFILDRPIRLNIVCGVMSVLFCLVAMRVKKSPILDLDITNCVAFYLLSFCVSRQMIQMKMHDLINRKELEQKIELEAALRESELANKAKTDFFSRMSHDMRTPMNGILGIARLSKDEQDVQVLKNNIEKMRISGEYLLDLINDTLDFQRIESGNLIIESQVIESGAFMDSIMDIVRQSAQEKHIDFSLTCKHVDTKSYIRIDPIHTKQIFLNLMSNAIKFTPEGGKVELEVDCTHREGQTSYIVASVSDTGIGMSEQYMKTALYQPFSQESNAYSAQYTGSGLGLSIVKKLVDAMGGSIEVNSKPNQGTVFVVKLAFDRVEGITLEAEKSEVDFEAKKEEIFAFLAGKRLLLAEDHDLNAEIAIKILQKAGCLVERASNGKEALEMFEQSKVNYYDSILMDIRMPCMDGLECAKAIRNADRTDAVMIPIIAMTANAYDLDVRQSMAAGMDVHLAKPINPELLYKSLYRQIKKKNEKG